MNFIKSLKPDNLTKILFGVFFILFGISIFLFIQLMNRNTTVEISPVKAQDQACVDHEYAMCCQAINVAAGRPANGDGPGVGGNCLPQDAASCQAKAIDKCTPQPVDEYPSGTDCKSSATNGCVPAEFKTSALGKLQNPYEMLYCRNLTGQRDSKGWYYGVAEAVGSQDNPFGSCGYDNLCQINGSGLHSGGEGTSCGNPYRCPEATSTPTPTPTPTPSTTNTPTPTGSTGTPTPTPTPTPIPPVCVNSYFEVNGQQVKQLTASNFDQTVVVRTQIRNADGSAGYLNIYNRDNVNGVPQPAIIPVRDADRNAQGQPVNSGMVLFPNSQIRTFVTPTKSVTNDITTYSWAVKVDRLFGSASNPVIDTATGQALKNVQMNALAGGTGNDSNCVIYLAQPTRTQQNPAISIVKERVSPDYQKVGSNIVFNITVRNTGDVDIRNFTLSDNFDPNYLQFNSAVYTKAGQDYVINPSATDTVNGRTRLTWNNMPPKSNIVPNEDGVLTVGESMTLTVNFKILKDTTQAQLLQHQNCGVTSTIQYVDDQGQTQEVTLNPAPQSCDEFNTSTETPLTATIDKTTLTPSVVLPNQVRFKGVLTNTDNEQRTYTKIDFADEYDTTYLKPNRVVVTNPAGRSATVTNILNTGTIRVLIYEQGNNASLKDINGNELGALPYNQSYTIELVFDSIASVDKTCDTIFADVANGNNGGTSNRDTACAEITPPPPPNTGADAVLNLLVPGIGMVATGAANFIIRRKKLA